MKLCTFFCLVLSVNAVFGQWASRVHLEDAEAYFNRVMRETVLRLEQRSFSSLKLLDITQTISQQMYKWHVRGNVTYTNGFLVSIQKVDVSNIQQVMSTSTADDVVYNLVTVQGRLNLRDMKIGFDVLAELEDDGDHRFTGTIVHTLLWFTFRISKNLQTQQLTVSGALESLSGGTGRMQYMPANNITQVLSRTYTASNIWSGVEAWCDDVIIPIFVDIIHNTHAFPPVCLDCR